MPHILLTAEQTAAILAAPRKRRPQGSPEPNREPQSQPDHQPDHPPKAKPPVGRGAAVVLPPAKGVHAPGPRLNRTLPSYMSRYKEPERAAIEAAIILDRLTSVSRSLSWSGEVLPPAAKVEKVANTLPEYFSYMQEEFARQPGRCLVGPVSFSDQSLIAFVEAQGRAALAPSSESAAKPVSLATLPYLLSGATLQSCELLAERVFTLLGFDPEFSEQGKSGYAYRRLSDVTCCLGFGEGKHAWLDNDFDVPADRYNRKFREDWAEHRARLAPLAFPGTQFDNDGFAVKTLKAQAKKRNVNNRQEWLRNTPTSYRFFSYVLSRGAFDCTLRDRISKMKEEVIALTQFVFNPTSRVMGKWAVRNLGALNGDTYADLVRVSDDMFASAVKRVFERSWFELDLEGRVNSLPEDVEVVMARALISRLYGTGQRSHAKAALVSPRTLLGAALLTGIPLGKWIQFGLDTLHLRGETFISSQSITDLRELVYDLGMYSEELGAATRCVDELGQFIVDLELLERDARVEAKAKWSKKLRNGSDLLWSHKAQNAYYVKDMSEDGEATYTVRPDHKLMGVNSKDSL